MSCLAFDLVQVSCPTTSSRYGSQNVAIIHKGSLFNHFTITSLLRSHFRGLTSGLEFLWEYQPAKLEYHQFIDVYYFLYH